jgi:hypothetical protein
MNPTKSRNKRVNISLPLELHAEAVAFGRATYGCGFSGLVVLLILADLDRHHGEARRVKRGLLGDFGKQVVPRSASAPLPKRQPRAKSA